MLFRSSFVNHIKTKNGFNLDMTAIPIAKIFVPKISLGGTRYGGHLLTLLMSKSLLHQDSWIYFCTEKFLIYDKRNVVLISIFNLNSLEN